jgi:hypothetical protein
MYKVERNNVEKISVVLENNELSTEIRNICLETPWLDALEAHIRANHSSVKVHTPHTPSSRFSYCFDHEALFN